MIDAGNAPLVRSYAGQGHLPNLAHVLATSAMAPIEHEPGLYVGSIWPTAFTGLGVDRHGFFAGVRHAPHSYDDVPDPVHGDPLWVDVSRAGRRVGVIDPPFFPVRSDIDADQVSEWGCHDRYWGTNAWPRELLDEVLDVCGHHPIGMIEHEYERFAPCDYVHCDDDGRTPEQTLAFYDDLVRSMQARACLSEHMATRAPYDLLVDVIAEVHCAGHQLWHLHDPTHPDHDPELAERLGGDPLLPIYRRVDDLVGRHLARLGEHDTAYVVLSHGMRAHFDGTLVLDEVLWRLDQRYRAEPTPWIGPTTQRLAKAARAARIPTGAGSARLFGSIVRRSLGRRAPVATEPSAIPGASERLWYQLDNFTVCAAVRFNESGREPNGVLGPGLASHAASWLIDELRALINVDTGEPAVESAYLTADEFSRSAEDGLPDLVVEWNRSQPIDRVWSPSVGLVAAPYRGLRTGDHDRFGEVHVLGPGIRPGRRPTMRGVDLAPTVAAATGVYLSDRDGRVIEDLVPGASTPPDPRRTVATLERHRARRPDDAPAEVDPVAALRRDVLDLRRTVVGLQAAHHETRQTADRAVASSSLALEVLATTRWIAGAEVSDDLHISVITPTRNRATRVGSAVRSVLGQTYANLELIVVDDASEDHTPDVVRGFDDPRLVPIRNPRRLGEGGSRNVGLDRATGDVVCFLDDDNCFDPDWLRSVAWAFTNDPTATVIYGARLIDDVRRHHTHVGGGPLGLEQLEWNRDACAERCLVDVNTLAHRRSHVRFDPELELFTDWDYLLHLTSEVDPVRVPVVATSYTTDAEDRATFEHGARHDEWYERVRARWSANGG